MNPDGRRTATTPAAVQPQTATAYHQPQYPGESSYLPQPDYSGHPAMSPTLPAPNRRHLWLLASLMTLLVLMVAAGASLFVFHYPINVMTNNSANPGIVSTKHASTPRTPDAQRRQDLLNIQTKLEAYLRQTGHYPLLSQLNSSDWTKANMPGLSPSVMTDPRGTVASLAGSPTPGQYAYQVYADAAQTDCEATSARCLVYILTATLNDGSIYVLRSASA